MPNWLVAVLIFVAGAFTKEIVSDVYKLAKTHRHRARFYLFLTAATALAIYGSCFLQVHNPVTPSDLRDTVIIFFTAALCVTGATMHLISGIIERLP